MRPRNDFQRPMPWYQVGADAIQVERADPRTVSPCPACGKTRAVPVDGALRCVRCGRERSDA